MKDIEVGITLVKPTGKVLDSNPQYIEIHAPDSDYEGKERSLTYYARPLYCFGYMGAPSEEFLTKYKNEIQIAIIHEQGSPDAPMWIGYTFADNKATDQPANFPRTQIFRTEKFFVEIDDEADKMTIAHRPDTTLMNNIVIDSDTITIGRADGSHEFMLLGETSVQWLKDLIKEIKIMVFATPAGNTTGLLTTPKFVALEAQIDGLLSSINKND